MESKSKNVDGGCDEVREYSPSMLSILRQNPKLAAAGVGLGLGLVLTLERFLAFSGEGLNQSGPESPAEEKIDEIGESIERINHKLAAMLKRLKEKDDRDKFLYEAQDPLGDYFFYKTTGAFDEAVGCSATVASPFSSSESSVSCSGERLFTLDSIGHFADHWNVTFNTFTLSREKAGEEHGDVRLIVRLKEGDAISVDFDSPGEDSPQSAWWDGDYSLRLTGNQILTEHAQPIDLEVAGPFLEFVIDSMRNVVDFGLSPKMDAISQFPEKVEAERPALARLAQLEEERRAREEENYRQKADQKTLDALKQWGN